MDNAQLLTADDVARRLQVKPETVKGWARDGAIPAVRLSPKVVRFDFGAVVDALKARQAEAR